MDMLGTTRRLGWSVALAAMLAATGCTDDPTEGNNTTNNEQQQNNPTGEIPENSKLLHVEPSCDPSSDVCTKDLQFNNALAIETKLVDGTGNPIPGVTITFETEFDEAAGTRLDAANADTDVEGLARTELSSADEAGLVTVTAAVAEDPSIDPIRFLVNVNPKGSAAFEVSFTHLGDSELKNIKALLFAPETTCDELEMLVESGQRLPTAQYVLDGQATAGGQLPTLRRQAVANGTTFTVYARGFARWKDDLEMADGCSDMNPVVESGRSAEAVVELEDHFPYVKGTYRVQHTFNLTEGLPPNIKTVVDIIGRVVNDPGSFLVGCAPNDTTCSGCSAGDMACQMNAESGLIDLVLDFLPDSSFSDTIRDILGTSLARSVVRDIVNDFLMTSDIIPDWVKTGTSVTGDIISTLQEFQVTGVIRLYNNPMIAVDESGNDIGVILEDDDPEDMVPKGGEHIWTDIIVHWRQGCDENAPPSCGERSVLGSLPQDQANVIGHFGATITTTNGYELTIDEHSLTLNYGALLLGIIEKVVLPEIFGPDIDSIDSLLGSIITCECPPNDTSCTSLPDRVVGEDPSATKNLVTTFCKTAVAEASTSLREIVTEELVASGDDVFTIGTPDGKPCTMQIADEPADYMESWPGEPLPYVNELGTEDMMCEWEVKVKFSDSYTSNISGDFHGDFDSQIQ